MMKPITINPETGALEQDISDIEVGDTVWDIAWGGKSVVHEIETNREGSCIYIRDSFGDIREYDEAGKPYPDVCQHIFKCDKHPAIFMADSAMNGGET